MARGSAPFSCCLRDAVRGGGPSTTTPASRASAAASPPTPTARRSTTARLPRSTTTPTWSSLGSPATSRRPPSRTAAARRCGDQIDYNGAPAGYADQPDEVISYVDAHDNETIWDSLTYKLPVSTSMPDRVRMNTMSLATTAPGPDAVVLHADRSAAQAWTATATTAATWSPTGWTWTGADNGFGHGLPPEADNGAKVALHEAAAGQRLAQAGTGGRAGRLGPGPGARPPRNPSPLFRLGSAQDIEAKVGFPVLGWCMLIGGGW